MSENQFCLHFCLFQNILCTLSNGHWWPFWRFNNHFLAFLTISDKYSTTKFTLFFKWPSVNLMHYHLHYLLFHINMINMQKKFKIGNGSHFAWLKTTFSDQYRAFIFFSKWPTTINIKCWKAFRHFRSARNFWNWHTHTFWISENHFCVFIAITDQSKHFGVWKSFSKWSQQKKMIR